MRILTNTEINNISGGFSFTLPHLPDLAGINLNGSLSPNMPWFVGSIPISIGIGISGTGGSFSGGAIGSAAIGGSSSLEKDS